MKRARKEVPEDPDQELAADPPKRDPQKKDHVEKTEKKGIKIEKVHEKKNVQNLEKNLDLLKEDLVQNQNPLKGLKRKLAGMLTEEVVQGKDDLNLKKDHPNLILPGILMTTIHLETRDQ